MVATSVSWQGLRLASFQVATSLFFFNSYFGCKFNLYVETPVPTFMSRPQRYVANSNGALHLQTSCNFVFFAETSSVALLMDPRRDIRLT